MFGNRATAYLPTAKAFHRMTNPISTSLWKCACSVVELAASVSENGVVGATCDPVTVLTAPERKMHHRKKSAWKRYFPKPPPRGRVERGKDGDLVLARKMQLIRPGDPEHNVGMSAAPAIAGKPELRGSPPRVRRARRTSTATDEVIAALPGSRPSHDDAVVQVHPNPDA